MGFFSDFQARRATKRAERKAAQAARAAQKAEVTYTTALAEWQEDYDEAAMMLEWARHGATGSKDDDFNTGIVLKKGEVLVGVYEKAALIEPRRQPGHYAGGYQGFSFRLAKGVRYNVGGSRGTYVQGNELPTAVDFGRLVITNQRVVFQGANNAREWAFSKMLGMTHNEVNPTTVMAVSNRQKVSGIGYDKENCAGLRFRLELARALFLGDTSSLVNELQGELEVLKTTKPLPPTPPPSALPSGEVSS